MVRVVTDSTCDIPAHLVRDLNIAVVPLNLHFGTSTFRDGVDITPEEFYERLASYRGLPTTSQPAVGTFQEVYRELADAGHDIISIHISSKLSGTHASAQTAARSFPDLRINVIDSQFTSMAQGFLVIAAAEAALRGCDLDEVTRLVYEMIPRLHLYVVLDTLEYLRRGGRIGKASAFLGTLLHIKPIIKVKDGEVVPVEKVRTRSQALRRLVELTRQNGPLERLAVAHAASPLEAEHLVDQLSIFFPHEDVLIANVGTVIGTHVGPGAVATLFVTK